MTAKGSEVVRDIFAEMCHAQQSADEFWNSIRARNSRETVADKYPQDLVEMVAMALYHVDPAPFLPDDELSYRIEQAVAAVAAYREWERRR